MTGELVTHDRDAVDGATGLEVHLELLRGGAVVDVPDIDGARVYLGFVFCVGGQCE
jgi:hypothetical protein